MDIRLACSTMLNIAIFCMALQPIVESSTRVAESTADRLGLLAFRTKIIYDPHRAMDSWNESLPVCRWNGVTCGQRHGRVITLSLASRGLVGTMSPSIANLTFLQNLTLLNNTLQGPISQELGHLSRLRILDLRNNSLVGRIPANLSRCVSLTRLALSGNRLVGSIPVELAALSKLQALVLHANNLTGEIPSSIGNLTTLIGISLMQNKLSGSIPDVFGKMQNLKILALGDNRLSGIIPPSICNLSSLNVFSVSINQLQGSLPSNFGLCFPALQRLETSKNLFSGSIPVSLSNASQLEVIDMTDNKFSGRVSIDFSSMQHLLRLNLGKNSLGSVIGDANEMNFLISLANCSSLQMLDIGYNQFKGILPTAIANFSIQVNYLTFSESGLYGSIPSGLSKLSNLIMLSFGGNQLTGTIPSDIGMIPKLQVLSVANNKLSGKIPLSLGNLSSLSEVYLDDNTLEGTIPPTIGKCQNLQALDASQNNLNGILPREIFMLQSMTYLNLSENHFVGSIPMEVGNLKALWIMDVSGNNLSGQITSYLRECTGLEYLAISDNSFHGSIPQSLSSLRGIKDLDLSQNNLSGRVPQFLETFPFLENLNLSFNDFEGELPMKGAFRNASAISLAGNNKLCGGVHEIHLPRCATKRPSGRKRSINSLQVKIIVSLCSCLGLLIISTLLIHFLKKQRGEPSSRILSQFGTSPLPTVSYRKLHKATNGFSASNLIGIGSFGSVYKGVIDQDDRVTVAIKVINLQKRGASKSFLAECEALRSIRHRNLLKIITTCCSADSQGNDFKALVYEFMPHGNLEMWLHHSDPKTTDGQREDGPGFEKLSFLQRLNVAIDVACALDYLHNYCKRPVIHCDLKPSNVLLDSEMTAHVGDFGLVRFVRELTDSHQSSSVGIRGTVGYSAPEYGIGNEPSASGDVYSFGVLLLEMVTGKRPTDPMFQGGLNLHSFARSALPDHVKVIADPTLLSHIGGEDEAEGSNSRRRRSLNEDEGCGGGSGREEGCLVSMVEVGVACSAESPNDRMEMSSVVRELHSIRDVVLGSRVSSSGSRIGSAVYSSYRTSSSAAGV